MKYLALENQETRKESTEIEFITERYISSNSLSFVSEDDFDNWYSNGDSPENLLNFSDIDFSEGSFIYIMESNGNIENFRVVEFETSKAEDIVKELSDFSISAKKANTTDTIYIELDTEIDGFDAIRISDHDANGKSSKLEIDINKISDIVDFCQELEQMISWEDLSLIENWIYNEK